MAAAAAAGTAAVALSPLLVRSVLCFFFFLPGCTVFFPRPPSANRQSNKYSIVSLLSFFLILSSDKGHTTLRLCAATRREGVGLSQQSAVAPRLCCLTRQERGAHRSWGPFIKQRPSQRVAYNLVLVQCRFCFVGVVAARAFACTAACRAGTNPSGPPESPRKGQVLSASAAAADRGALFDTVIGGRYRFHSGTIASWMDSSRRRACPSCLDGADRFTRTAALRLLRWTRRESIEGWLSCKATGRGRRAQMWQITKK